MSPNRDGNRSNRWIVSLAFLVGNTTLPLLADDGDCPCGVVAEGSCCQSEAVYPGLGDGLLTHLDRWTGKMETKFWSWRRAHGSLGNCDTAQGCEVGDGQWEAGTLFFDDSGVASSNHEPFDGGEDFPSVTSLPRDASGGLDSEVESTPSRVPQVPGSTSPSQAKPGNPFLDEARLPPSRGKVTTRLTADDPLPEVIVLKRPNRIEPPAKISSSAVATPEVHVLRRPRPATSSVITAGALQAKESDLPRFAR